MPDKELTTVPPSNLDETGVAFRKNLIDMIAGGRTRGNIILFPEDYAYIDQMSFAQQSIHRLQNYVNILFDRLQTSIQDPDEAVHIHASIKSASSTLSTYTQMYNSAGEKLGLSQGSYLKFTRGGVIEAKKTNKPPSHDRFATYAIVGEQLPSSISSSKAIDSHAIQEEQKAFRKGRGKDRQGLQRKGNTK